MGKFLPPQLRRKRGPAIQPTIFFTFSMSLGVFKLSRSSEFLKKSIFVKILPINRILGKLRKSGKSSTIYDKRNNPHIFAAVQKRIHELFG